MKSFESYLSPNQKPAVNGRFLIWYRERELRRYIAGELISFVAGLICLNNTI